MNDMNSTIGIKKLLHPEKSSIAENTEFHRNMLALDAMSNLSRQFSKKPDLGNLVDSLLLTLSGQFTVSSAFAGLYPLDSSSEKTLYFGTGHFRNNSALITMVLTEDQKNLLLESNAPVSAASLDRITDTDSSDGLLTQNGVEWLAPLIHDNRLLGVIGLGARVTGAKFGETDLGLLATFTKTITPFIENTFLFAEIGELNKWYLDILDSVEQGVYVFGQDHKLKKVNLAGMLFSEMFSPELNSFDSLIGLTPAELFPETMFLGWSKKLMSVMAGGQGALLENLVVKLRDVEQIFNIWIGPIKDISGNQSDMVMTLIDVTAQRVSAHRLFELEKFAEKGVMASSIAHELNNFLGLILGGAEIAQMALKKGNLEKVGATMEKLKDHVRRMERFTGGLMDYTRLDTSKHAASLNNVLNDVVSFVAVDKKFAGIEVLVDFDPAIDKVLIDTDQLSQLLLNLINNAAEAINLADHTRGQIRLSTRLCDGMITMTVSDNGVGMPPEVKQKLFRAHFTTKKDGHGYGLVTCNKIIDNHGGKMEVESERGKGTTFMFTFPADGSDTTITSNSESAKS